MVAAAAAAGVIAIAGAKQWHGLTDAEIAEARLAEHAWEGPAHGDPGSGVSGAQGIGGEGVAAAPAVAPAPRAERLDALPNDVLVYLIQRELVTANYYGGALTGKAAPGLTAAIRAYQRARGGRADGEASRDLLLRLMRENLGRTGDAPEAARARAAPAAVAGPEPLREAQELLHAAGFDPGPADGVLGPRTRSAIESYQRVHALEVGGVAVSDLLVHLKTAAYETQALGQFARGRFEEAARSFTQMIVMRPEDADAYFNRGLAFSRAGLARGAIRDFRTALRLAPMHVSARIGLGQALYREGRYTEALSAYAVAAWAWIRRLGAPPAPE